MLPLDPVADLAYHRRPPGMAEVFMDEPTPAPGWRAHILPFLLLALLAVGVRSWVLCHTEVAARDSIGFIRYALHLENPPAWPLLHHKLTDPRPTTIWQVIRHAEQPPGYPLAVLAASKFVRPILGTTPDALVLSAQLASGFFGVLLIIPTYLLGLALFDRRTGFGAAALFQCLPGCVAITCDALSEAMYLFAVATTLWLAVRAVRTPTWPRLAGVGVGVGLAYLVRPEGLELGVAVAAVLLGRWLLTRTHTRQTATALAGLAVGVALIAGPYMALIGRLSNKPTANSFIEGVELPPVGAAAKLSACVWAAFLTEQTGTLGRCWWATKTLFAEMLQAGLFAVLPLALYALARGYTALKEPGAWVPLVFAGLHAALLWRMGVLIGYISERHTLPLVLVGVFWAVGGLSLFAANLKRRLNFVPVRAVANLGIGVFLFAAVVSTMSKKPLHQNRAGHHAAGSWLAHRAGPDDVIIDPFCWAHYYAGAVFDEGKRKPRKPEEPARHYIIWEPNANQHSRLPTLELARKMKEGAGIVYTWPENRPAEVAAVVVYELPPPQ